MFILLCLISTSALVSAARTDCIDAMAGCEKLSAVYCLPPYEQYARDACPRRCGFCEEESVQKRSHGHVSWVDHCWDQGHDHLQDPFCALLTTTIPTTTTPKPTTTTVTTTTTTTVPTTTTTTPPTTTTTTEPPTTTTTTTEPPTTTTTTMPTTTTTMPTTTTTMTTTTTTMTTTTTTMTTTTMTTTTTEPTTTSSTEPPTTTPRNCRYDMINDKDIHNTDFATDVELIENANTTFNESVHLISDIEFCQGVCAQSVLNDGYECWAFTFNEQDRCYLYYYSRPLYLIEAGGLFVNGTTLFLKRCSDDPSTRAPPTQPTTITTMPTTMAPVDESTTTTQATTTTVVTGPPNQTPGGIIMINQNTYSKLGGPTPVPNTCYFLNQTFALGEHFKDSCRFDCLCDDVTVNRAVCTNVCPFYTSIPDYCSLVQRNGECCAELDCQNATDTTNMTGSGDGGDCDNTIDQCDFYPDSACVNVYEPWARAHCALRCGYCPGKTEPCVDRIAYCRLYELDTACKAYAGWARHNCKQSCAIC